MADEVWIDVLPSLKGFGAELIKGTTAASKTAGSSSGKAWGRAFEDGADGGADAAMKELESAEKQAAGLVQKLSGDVSKARQAQKNSAAALITAEQRLADATSKYGEESSQARAAALRLDAARDKATGSAQKFENAENALRDAHKGHKTVVGQLEKAQQDLNSEVKEAPGLWGKLSGGLGKAGDKMKGFATSTGGLVTQLAGAVGGAALFSEAFTNALDNEAGIDKLSARLAATPEQSKIYGEAAGNLYAGAWGDSMDDVTNAVDAVVSSMGGMRDASQPEIEAITANALDLASAFEVDVAESTATAGTLMKTGLAGDATQAMDLITGAMNNVPAHVRGEILPVMSEYSKHFEALGIDGETAMGMIVASSGDGAIGMDKMGDALKEFTIRATDMSKATSDTYDLLGLDMETMTNKMLEGGPAAEDAMGQIVHALQGIKDPGEQAAAAISLFGTPLEDLGTDKIPDFLGMVDPMGDAFASMDGAAATLGDTLNDNTATSLETVKRSFGKMLSDGIQPLLGPLQGVAEWAMNTPGVLEAAAVAVGILSLAVIGLTIAASPWLIWGVAAAAVIGGIILVVKNWGSIMEWFGDIWGKVTSWISDKWEAAAKAVTGWWKREIQPTIDLAGRVFKLLYSQYVQPALDWVMDKWQDVSKSLRRVYDNVIKPVFDTFGSLIKGDLPGAFKHGVKAIKGFWNELRNVAAKPVNFVIETVYNNGIRKAINSAADAIGLGKKINLPEATPIPKYAKGGLAKPGWALVGEEGPELINFDKPGRVYTASETQNALGLSDEGLEAAAGRRPEEAMLPMGGWWQNIQSGAAKAFGKATSWIRGGLASAAGLVLNPIKDGVSSALGGQGAWGDLAAGAATTSIDGVLDWIRGKDAEASASGGAIYDGPLGAFHRPSNGPITSRFGPRWGGFHTGTDIAGGGPTYAALPGVVQRVGWNAVPGKTGIGIYLNHGPDLWTYYGHNPVGGAQVSVGDQVKAGQHIGYQGATGNVTGTHVHFEVHKGRVNGVVNPEQYLYDSGGYLQPGTTQVLNKTGRPEPVLTPEQDDRLQRIANGDGGGDTYYLNVDADLSKIRTLADLEEFIDNMKRLARQKSGTRGE